MIKSVTVTNHIKESLCLELMKPEKSGFIIEKIEGLGPVKADINLTEMATVDGALDNSARIGTRNIVISLIFLENPTIEDTRQLTYKYFPIKQNITLEIETDNRKCKTIGRVENNEPDIFSKQEGCQISIICSDPYFYSVQDEENIFYGVDPLFEFPFSNESLDTPLIEMGKINHVTQANILYEGDIDVGMIIKIHAIGPANGISIISRRTRQIMRIDNKKLESLTGSTLQAGDDIIINTNKGEKGIQLLRGGEYTNIINVLGKPIEWFSLTKGVNQFVYSAEEGLSYLNFTITNKVAYGGI